MYKGTATVGYSSSLGYYVLITSTPEQHSLDFETNTIHISYGHLSSYIASINGKTLEVGTLIGYTGNSGSIASTIGVWQYHLHVTIYSGDYSNKYNRVNPVNYLTTKFDSDGNKIE